MRNILIYFILLININLLFGHESIKITTARNKVAIFPIKLDNDAKIGDKYIVFRFQNGNKTKIGIVEITKIINDKAGIKLITTYNSDHIEKGDVLEKDESLSDDSLLNNIDDTKKNTVWSPGIHIGG
jgi:hypothetical protein